MMVVVMFVCHNSIFLQSKAMADISAIPNYYEINSTITLYTTSTLMASTIDYQILIILHQYFLITLHSFAFLVIIPYIYTNHIKTQLIWAC